MRKGYDKIGKWKQVRETAMLEPFVFDEISSLDCVASI